MIIVFDLDGTISDPLIGVAKSINYALAKLGVAPKNQEDLAIYIGPPLHESFAQLLGKDDADQVQAAIAFFRERYIQVGYRENTIYPGITEMLQRLASARQTLYIATNKKTSIAKSVADYFQITPYFKDILGCGLKHQKIELLNIIKSREASNHGVMIGDRSYDMRAGNLANFYCIGVSWGYGSRKELLESCADLICDTPESLKNFLSLKLKHSIENDRA